MRTFADSVFHLPAPPVWSHATPANVGQLGGRRAGHCPTFATGAVNTAFAVLKEGSIVVPGHRRTHVSASRDVYLDAMTEYHALRERPTA